MRSVCCDVEARLAGADGRWLVAPETTMSAAGVEGGAPMSTKTFVVICWMMWFGSPSPAAVSARPRDQYMVPVANTVAVPNVYFVTFEFVEPDAVVPFGWIRLPVTGDVASVLMPAGSCPLPTRASHSQPIRPVPRVVEVPGAWVSRPVFRKTGSWPSEALTTIGYDALSLSPTYISPSSAFSGCPIEVSRQRPVAAV